MDRRFVLGLIVCLLFVMLWYAFVQPLFSKNKPAPPPTPVEGPATKPDPKRPESGPAAKAASRPVVNPAEIQTPVLENEDLRLTFSSAGAVLTKAELKHFRKSPFSDDPLDLLRHYPGLPRGLELRDLGDPDAWLEQRAWRVEKTDDDTITFVLEKGVSGFESPYRVRKQIRLAKSGMHAEVTMSLEYLGQGAIAQACRLTPSGGISLDSDFYGTHDLTGAESLTFQDDPQEGEKLLKTTPLEMSKVEAKAGEEPQKTFAFNGRRRFVADVN